MVAKLLGVGNAWRLSFAMRRAQYSLRTCWAPRQIPGQLGRRGQRQQQFHWNVTGLTGATLLSFPWLAAPLSGRGVGQRSARGMVCVLGRHATICWVSCLVTLIVSIAGAVFLSAPLL
ncbi:hypothetical protein E2C01_092796 [Portunus trituberculatus]|uniref:Uncharacterized protein n=1 Tax=Portunus trituberculatus TaxID=210409 RepID=A0A5B7JWV1_PORTR|nr:hypothetical protein [Portunus trituberculatus]